MIDREKVQKGLECCREMNGHACQKCPYISDCNNMSVAGISHLASDALTLLKEQPQWHPFNPVEPDTDGLEDHNFYLVTVKGFGTPMKAMYHIDMPFGFAPPPTKEFDPYDVIAWRELPDNMNGEVSQNVDD